MGKYVTAVSSEELRRDGALFASAESPLDVALTFTEQILKVNRDDFIVLNHYTSSGIAVTHVDLKQVLNGIPVENTSIRIHVDKNKHVCAYEDRFFRGNVSASLSASPPQFVSIDDAFATLANRIKENPNSISVTEVSQERESIESLRANYKAKDDSNTTNRAFGEKTYYYVENASIEPAWKFLVSLPMHEYESFVSADGKKVLANHDRVIVG
jgi:Zn-dependent metalloprotease